MNDNDPVPCPRCGEPRLKITMQDQPAKPYWRCCACGATGTEYAFNASTGEFIDVEKERERCRRRSKT